MKNKTMVAGLVTAVALGSMITAYAAIVGAKKEGLVEYVGEQKEDLQDRQSVKRGIS